LVYLTQHDDQQLHSFSYKWYDSSLWLRNITWDIYICIYKHMYIHVCKHINTHMSVCVYIYTYIYIYITTAC
jgi:hypothetical protein